MIGLFLIIVFFIGLIVGAIIGQNMKEECEHEWGKWVETEGTVIWFGRYSSPTTVLARRCSECGDIEMKQIN